MKVIALAAACGVLACAGTAAAQASTSPLDAGRFALGLGAGTNGGSLEAAYSVGPYLVLRGQGAYIGFDADVKSNDVRYHGVFRQETGGAMADLHLFPASPARAFFVSGGFVSGDRVIKLKANPTETVTVKVNGVSVPVSGNVFLNGEADLGSTAPFAGLGYDNTFTHAGHWGFRAVAGVIFGQDPKVSLAASGPYASNPVVQADVADEQASLQRDVDGYRYYPVVQVGLTYRF